MATKKTTAAIKLTSDEEQDLRNLASCLKAKEDAANAGKAIVARRAYLIDANEEELRKGVKLGDLKLTLKISRQLIAEIV